MSDILVTGGAGFIGSHLVDALLAKGESVIVLDDLSGGFRENVNPDARFIEGNILNNKLIERIFTENKIRFVFHLAAYAAEGLSHFIKRYNYRNNLIGSVNLINAAVNHDVERFCFTSSLAVYGACECPMSEDMTPRPLDSYGIAKLAVEQELFVSLRLFGLDYVIFRPHNVYGERQNIGDRYRNVVGIFMNQIMRGEPLTIFGDGSQTRAFSYVGDVAPAMADSVYRAEARNQIFNIGSDRPTSVNELASCVCDAMGVRADIRHTPEREEVKHAYCSHAKIRDVLGYEDTCSLEEGLKRMSAWAKQHGSRQSATFKRIEITRNLPTVWL